MLLSYEAALGMLVTRGGDSTRFLCSGDKFTQSMVQVGVRKIKTQYVQYLSLVSYT